jgi:hypothetical protein
MLMEGLRFNRSLTSLNVSSNSLGTACVEALGAVLSGGVTPLVALDLSVNNLDDRCASVRLPRDFTADSLYRVVVTLGARECRWLRIV